MNQAHATAVSEVLYGRQSIRNYQKGKTIPQEILKEIISLATLAPTSWNLQHWKYIVIQDQARKESLVPIAYDQSQVADCSALVVVLGDKEANESVEKIYKPLVEKGQMKPEAYEQFKKNVDSAYAKNGEAYKTNQAVMNASFGAMQLMIAAKAHGIDSGPMGGFDPEKLKEALRIPDRYQPVMLVTLGYRAEEPRRTSRLGWDDVVVEETF
jgi:nitroreductase